MDVALVQKERPARSCEERAGAGQQQGRCSIGRWATIVHGRMLSTGLSGRARLATTLASETVPLEKPPKRLLGPANPPNSSYYAFAISRDKGRILSRGGDTFDRLLNNTLQYVSTALGLHAE